MDTDSFSREVEKIRRGKNMSSDNCSRKKNFKELYVLDEASAARYQMLSKKFKNQ
jgi:hypothetical protein